MTNDIVLLFQFIGNIKFTDNFFFVQRNKIPQDSKVTYFLIVYNIRPHRKETHWVHITVLGKKLFFKGPFSTPTSGLKTSKLHSNSALSTPGSKYLVVDVKTSTLTTLFQSMSTKYYDHSHSTRRHWSVQPHGEENWQIPLFKCGKGYVWNNIGQYHFTHGPQEKPPPLCIHTCIHHTRHVEAKH